MKIFRDQPDTLQGAVVIATNEQNLRARVQLSHSYTTVKETLMEVDHSRGQKFRYKIDLKESIVRKIHSPDDQSDVGTVVRK